MNPRISPRQSRALPAFYVLSASRSDHTPATNAARNAALREELDAWNLPSRTAVGHTAQWGEEESAVVFVPAGQGSRVRALILDALRRYHQEAAVYVTPARVAYLITGPGFSRHRLGTWQGVSGSLASWDGAPPSGDYTQCGSEYFTIAPDSPAPVTERITNVRTGQSFPVSVHYNRKRGAK